MKRKILFGIIILLLQTFCFSQNMKSILGISLGDTKDNVNKNFSFNDTARKTTDTKNENFPINYEIYSNMDIKFNGIPVEKITFSYNKDQLFCISIVTEPTDDLDLLLDSRRVVKDYYNFEKKEKIDIDESFYDKRANPVFYSSLDNPDFILIIYGTETRGKIYQNYSFIAKSLATDAIKVKRQYQKYSSINNYTNYTLDELEKLAIEKEKNDEIARKEQEKIEQKQKEEAKKKELLDGFMGGISGVYFTAGVISGENAGGFGAFDISLKLFGPISLGVDLRLGEMDQKKNNDMNLRADIDAYLSLGLGIPFIPTKYEPPVIFGAVAAGAYMLQLPNTSYYSNKEMINDDDTFIEIRGGLQFSIASWVELRFVYSKEYTKKYGEMDIFSLAIGGRF